jgi:hypothetical protein
MEKDIYALLAALNYLRDFKRDALEFACREPFLFYLQVNF